MKKLPPIEKIYEAYSAIADNRIKMSEGTAEVQSSNNSKIYDVQWENDTYKSNDNATYWQGYPGYPVLAVLMLQGRLPLNGLVASHFKGINWGEINMKYKADYTKAAAYILYGLKADGVDINPIVDEVKIVFDAVKSIPIEVKRGMKKRTSNNNN